MTPPTPLRCPACKSKVERLDDCFRCLGCGCLWPTLKRPPETHDLVDHARCPVCSPLEVHRWTEGGESVTWLHETDDPGYDEEPQEHDRPSGPDVTAFATPTATTIGATWTTIGDQELILEPIEPRDTTAEVTLMEENGTYGTSEIWSPQLLRRLAADLLARADLVERNREAH